MVCEAGEDECGFFVFEWFVFDWLVFDGMFFLERIFFRRMVYLYADGTKKDPGFVFETGVFVCGKRDVVPLSFANILRTDDVEDFKACGFHGSDEFFIAHGSFKGDIGRAVC